MNNYKYWEQFYKNQHILEPSDFARSLNLRNKRIIDMGCGKGRDTFHFKNLGNNVIGVDEFSPDVAGFKKMKIEDYLKLKCDCGSSVDHRDVLYMRFLLQAIDEDLENDIFNWIIKNIDEIYIECRSDKGIVPDDSHQRRLINGEELKLKVVSSGFDIKYFAEQTGFAPYKNEDPVIIRLVAKR